MGNRSMVNRGYGKKKMQLQGGSPGEFWKLGSYSVPDYVVVTQIYKCVKIYTTAHKTIILY